MGKNEIAVALAKMRWKKTTKRERKAHARMMAERRWARKRAQEILEAQQKTS